MAEGELIFVRLTKNGRLMRGLQLFLIFPFICQNLMESGKEGSVHMSSEGKPNDTGEHRERSRCFLCFSC